MAVTVAEVEARRSMARALCAKAGRLCATAQALRWDALVIKAHSQEVRGARRLFGGSTADNPEIVSLIRALMLCTTCIGFKIGIPRNRVDAELKDIRRSLVLMASVARCEACLKQTVVYALK